MKTTERAVKKWLHPMGRVNVSSNTHETERADGVLAVLLPSLAALIGPDDAHQVLKPLILAVLRSIKIELEDKPTGQTPSMQVCLGDAFAYHYKLRQNSVHKETLTKLAVYYLLMFDDAMCTEMVRMLTEATAWCVKNQAVNHVLEVLEQNFAERFGLGSSIRLRQMVTSILSSLEKEEHFPDGEQTPLTSQTKYFFAFAFTNHHDRRQSSPGKDNLEKQAVLHLLTKDDPTCMGFAKILIDATPTDAPIATQSVKPRNKRNRGGATLVDERQRK